MSSPRHLTGGGAQDLRSILAGIFRNLYAVDRSISFERQLELIDEAHEPIDAASGKRRDECADK